MDGAESRSGGAAGAPRRIYHRATVCAGHGIKLSYAHLGIFYYHRENGVSRRAHSPPPSPAYPPYGCPRRVFISSSFSPWLARWPAGSRSLARAFRPRIFLH